MRRCLGFAVMVVSLVLPATAGAASVEVEETPGNIGSAKVIFTGASSESNQLTISGAAESGNRLQLHLLDTSAGIDAGRGCSGGGSPGVAVDCSVPKPTAPYLSCGKSSCTYPPGSRWDVSLIVSLGNDDSKLDASSLPVFPQIDQQVAAIAVKVLPGSGSDTILTSAGNDEVLASPGEDTVRTAGGQDKFFGGAGPDGADDVNLSEGRDIFDYGARASRVLYRDDELANDGAPGESDKLVSGEEFTSGAGDDDLVGSGKPAQFFALGFVIDGGPGNDQILGGPGDDLLGGGPGNDVVAGEGGDDRIGEALWAPQAIIGGNDDVEGGPGRDEIEVAYGDDRVDGGEGDDEVKLGPGADEVDGGAGNDLLLGDEGDDHVAGGDGDDRLIGNEGHDGLYGGEGDDRLLSGAITRQAWERNFLYSPGPLEGARDVVDCGPGSADRAGVDRTDSILSCEKTIPLRRLELVTPILQTHGQLSAQLQYEARVPGRISLTGSGLVPRNRYTPAIGQEEDFTQRLFLRLIGWAKQRMARYGRVTVRIKVVLRPAGGGKIVRVKNLRLVRASG